VDLPLVILQTSRQQQGIELGEGGNLGEWDKIVASDVANAMFDAAFLMAFAGRTEVAIEEIVAAKDREGTLLLTGAAGEERLDCGGEVVVAQAVGDTLKVVEGVDMRLEEGFLTLGGKGHGKGSSREAQTHDEELDGELLSLHEHDGLTPVDLSILTRVKLEREEDGRPLEGATLLANVGADMAFAALIAVGFDQGKHAVRGIALFVGKTLILG
jgi:hypothetical protein